MYREQGGQRHVNELKESSFELALHSDAGLDLFDVHDDGGVRPAEQFGQDNSGLRVAVVVGLQAGEDQVELFIFDGGGKGFCSIESIKSDEGIVFEVDGAVSALGQSFAQHLLGAGRAGSDDHHFSGVLFLLAQRLFQREGVRLVHFIRDVFADPGRGFVELERRIFLRHLLHANQDFQT